ncbi:hypothetical protein JI745_00380 [Piscinibacter sp. HJYY11]|nr:hypothetical protein [Piscinibacter sp. HJYY11]
MEIRFTKHARAMHSIEETHRASGPDLRMRARETGPTLPHDLVHAAVEAALGLERGFWGAVNRGATFAGFEPMWPTRHARSGLKQLRQVGEVEMAVEHKVSWAHRVWSGQRTEGAGLGPPPLAPVELSVTSLALDRAMEKWRLTPEDGSLVWYW